jgi:diguanylate cyclase (GGDEF)-like protein/PAS domain S-box-containing protein
VPRHTLARRFSRLLAPLPLKTVLVAVFVLQMAIAIGLLSFLTIYLGTWQIAILSALAIVLSVVAGLAVVQRILHPIHQFTEAARAMAHGNWQTPLPTDRFDEMGQLAVAFNDMAAQLRMSFAELENLNQALQQSERRWRQFLDVIPLGITVYNRQGSLVFASQEARRLLNLEDLPSVPSLGLEATFVAYRADSEDRYPPEALPIARALNGEKASAEDIELHLDDRKIPIEIATTPIFDRQGRVEYAIAAFQDISTRKQAQKVLADYNQMLERQVAERTTALRQAEATQRVILEAIPDLLMRFSKNGICLDIMNAGKVEMIVDPRQQIGKPMAGLLPPEMVAERMHYIHLALKTGKPQVYEYQFDSPEGLRYEEARVVLSGKNEVLVIVRDITERKQAEISLRESQMLYRSLTEVLPHGLYRINRAGHYTFANPAFLATLGYSLGDCLGKTVDDLYPPDVAQAYAKDNFQVMSSGQAIKKIEIYTDSDNSKRYTQVLKSPLYNAEGDIIGMQGVFWDVTDLKRTEAALDSQKQFLQNVIDNIPSAIVVTDVHNRIQIANRASAAMHGMLPADMLGQLDTGFNIVDSDGDSNADVTTYDDLNQQVIETQTPFQAAQEIIDSDGVSRWYQVIISPFQDSEGQVAGVISNCIDITDRRHMEIALKHANEKLERLATLDGLTHIPNRRRFDEYLEQEWQRMVREQQPLSLILFDVDFFKAYNDHFGHQQGDEALIAIAQAANRAVKRASDLLARYGGEEFAIILPNTRRTGAEIVARGIQEQVKALALEHPHSTVDDYVTVSMGIASVVPVAEQAPEDLIAAADAALYQAKRRGRNRFWIRLI